MNNDEKSFFSVASQSNWTIHIMAIISYLCVVRQFQQELIERYICLHLVSFKLYHLTLSASFQ